ncbi:MAG: hypothetical protein A3F82_00585 [Deltaproteobacteria bacterium RIFCSPLOWO2_12_FULL_44_12]|nr:MAG: hypothetical protein A2712_04370 [Deltaproteobacteria bacterium RIFCSPHIGHO2_01_FULL_43_49]OGQ16419.1 MAG: hypothetical protein A3D22_02335 [Deltaproteobacteria bacterium RIFCSPHIGHO2_02_FULL_44_53]OGQ27754.1 MAG: hypothetical protein A3D98_08650 [Deltaproteobacteria bacterium RIFCSPHIGHO2_12_FULL_44_21]OGQ32937.1 MAG: hypothetical protein A2979_10265 [Deltaproteobacteria bacterium RIFCSPLOWO2_01_FULL_45_74]OGQ42039.1 MAG: hypothetical protein A3I70_10055 [Deltaproteobacteria bacterium 
MKLSNEVKVGLFAAAIIIIITMVTIRVGDKSIISGGDYDLMGIFTNATGLYPKAAVEVAGVSIGVVKNIGLTADGKAQVTMGVNRDVHLPQNSRCFLRTRGFLGEAFVEIIPGDSSLPPLKDGEFFTTTESGGDINGMVNQFNSIADDVKEITHTLKGWVNEKEGGAIASTVNNLNDFVKVMRDLTTKNEQNLDRIVNNMADLTHEIKSMVQNSKQDVENSMDRIASITQKIDEGRGTIGKLVNDPETAQKLNDAVDSLNEALGGYKKMELGFGFQTEYLNRSKDFKNYFNVSLSPTPDESILLGLVSDPSPDTKREKRITGVTVGGTTTTVTTENEVLQRDSVLFSAQLAKKFYDFTIRGGIIESKGGVGLDYLKGPVGVSFSAFDFENKFNEKPHLKLTGSVNVTQNLYLVGGADDPLNPAQKTDYFVGGGFRLVDDDIKSLLGLSSMVKK